MSEIRVRPIDMSAPGSFRERSRVLRVLRAINNDELTNIEGQIALEDVILPRLETTDGSDLDAALDKLSAKDFDDLLIQIWGVQESAVPTESAEN